MRSEAQRATSRRVLLGGLAAVTLTGCGVRLERDAPQVPGLRSQGPVADQATLLATLASVQELVRTAQGIPTASSPWVSPLLTMHQGQVSRLVNVMAGLGIDVPSVAGSSSRAPAPAPSSTPSASGTTPAAPTAPRDTPPPTTPTSTTTSTDADVAKLMSAERNSGAGATEDAAWSSTPANRPLLTAIAVTRRAASMVLGDPDPWPRGAVPATVNATAMARAIRPAVYGFEVIAARTPARDRSAVTATLGWLYGLRSDLEAVVAEPEPAAYALPVQVTDDASARQLAQVLLSRVVTAAASQVLPVTPQGEAPREWLLRVWSLSSADGWRWGSPTEPFPGLTA